MAFLDAPAKYVSLMGFATFNSVVVTILAIIHIIYITRCVGNDRVQANLYWLSLLFPVDTCF